jgi:hypothetical protein
MRYWEIIADNLSASGWSWGCISAVDSEGRTIWIVDAHRDNGKRFVVLSDEKLTAFLELERITHELALLAQMCDASGSCSAFNAASLDSTSRIAAVSRSSAS